MIALPIWGWNQKFVKKIFLPKSNESNLSSQFWHAESKYETIFDVRDLVPELQKLKILVTHFYQRNVISTLRRPLAKTSQSISLKKIQTHSMPGLYMPAQTVLREKIFKIVVNQFCHMAHKITIFSDADNLKIVKKFKNCWN